MQRIWSSAIVAALLLTTIGLPMHAQEPKVFARSNLVAWCIVPFDGKNRGPAERATMVKNLGFTKVAYDWRDNHVASFEEEILQYQKHGIEYFAFCDTYPKALERIADSGYAGPVGIIGHTNDDVELRLRDNLDGLDWILPQLAGKAAGPRPTYRTK